MGDTYWHDGAGWMPIATSNDYAATFDGKGHTISNLFINRNNTFYVALFGRARGAAIRNVGLENVDVTQTGSVYYAAALVGAATGGTDVVNCYSTGRVSGNRIIGGLVGLSFSKIIRSYSMAAVSGNGDVGGLVGTAETIIASYAIGPVTGGSTVAGLVGRISLGGITASYATGRVIGTADTSGLVGNGYRVTITDSYYDRETTGQSDTDEGTPKSTSELQEPTGYTGIYKNWNVDVDGDRVPDNPWNFGTASEYPTLNTASQRQQVIDYDGDNDGLIDVDSLDKLNAIRHDLNGDGLPTGTAADTIAYAGAFPGGDITSSSGRMGCPSTCTGYELLNNLDFDTDGDNDVDASDAYPNWTAIGVAPSGVATAFSATFDGDDYTISNLSINSSTSTTTGGGFVGLFGDVSGTIRDVGLLNVNVTNARSSTTLSFGRTGALAARLSAGGTVSGSYVAGGSVTHNQSGGRNNGYAGGLLGFSGGTVSDSYATCNVVGASLKSLFLGGLIGESTGAVDTTYATGTITVTGNSIVSVGGLIGKSAGTLSVSYATGNVSGSGRGEMGGLAGVLDGTSFATYATGNVSGTGVKAGGLTGHLAVQDNNSINAVYAIGTVSNTSTGTTATGGLGATQGGNTPAMINSYWDTQTTGQTTTVARNVLGETTTGGQTTSTLQSPTGYTAGSIYANWNLNLDGQPGNDDPWTFGATDQYPVLKYAGMDITAQFKLQPVIVRLAFTPSMISESGDVSTVTATLAHPSSAATTITVRPVTGTYTVGIDSTITIAAGSTANAMDTVEITAVNNDIDAANNDVTVQTNVENDHGAGSVTGVLTIIDDEVAPDVTLMLSPSSISENGEVSTVSATLSHPSSATTTITVSAEAVSPATAADFTLSTADTLIIAATATTSTDTVTITAVDNDDQADAKTVTVSVTAQNTQGITDPSPVTLTITDDEAPSVTLDVDDDGQVLLLSDLLLIIRHYLGFEEGTLMRDLVPENAKRKTYRELDDYISTLTTERLDVDDDGQVLLSDLLLIIRHYLGFEEGTLMRGLVPENAKRKTHQDITPYIKSLYPPSQ